MGGSLEASQSPNPTDRQVPKRVIPLMTRFCQRRMNNIGIGLSASIAGLTLFPAAVATLACSLLFLFAGNEILPETDADPADSVTDSDHQGIQTG